jgi:hypothetical protein
MAAGEGEHQLHRILSHVDGRFAPAIVSMSARARLQELAGDLAATSGTGLECHLGDPDRVDLAQRRLASERVAGPSAFEHVGWWCYDAVGARQVHPGIYLGPGARADPSVIRSSLNPWIHMLGRLQGAPVPAGIRNSVRKRISRIRPDAAVPYLGLLGRPESATVRVTVESVHPDELDSLLSALGWTGKIGADVRAALSAASAYPSRLNVQVDMGEAVAPNLGLELRPTHHGAWSDFLHAVLRPELHPLIPALLSWHSLDMPAHGEHRTPPPGYRMGHRCLNHIKLDVRPGSDTAVKAYLFLGLIKHGDRP